MLFEIQGRRSFNLLILTEKCLARLQCFIQK